MTELGTYGFDEATGEMTLLTMHPGVTMDDVRSNTGWDPRCRRDLGETPPPTEEELRMIREELDPAGGHEVRVGEATDDHREPETRARDPPRNPARLAERDPPDAGNAPSEPRSREAARRLLDDRHRGPRSRRSGPMSHVFPRVLDRELPTAVRAEGVWITDADGKRYLDGAGGAIVVNVGHGDRR